MKFCPLLLLLVLFGCAMDKKTADISTVSISTDGPTQLEIDSSKRDSYGPTSKTLDQDENTSDDQSIREPIVQLNIYSSLYASLALVDYFKQAEKENIKFSVIVSNGFASLISVLYAQNQSVSYVEWKLFELIKKVSKAKVYSEDWNTIIKDFLKKEFKDKKLQQLKSLVVIPKINKGKLELNNSGKIVDAVMNSLSITKKDSYLISPYIYDQIEKNYGADLRLAIAFMPKKMGFKQMIDYEWGVFASYLSFLEKNKQAYQSIESHGDKKYYIDELAPLSDMTEPFSEAINENIKALKDSIKDWKQKVSTSSI